MLKRLASLLLISFVAACGGGGGDAGTSPFGTGSGGSTGGGGTSTALPTLSLALSNTSVSSANPATVTATVLDAKGQPVPSTVVTFRSERGLGTLNVETALTNASGQAVVSLAPASSTVGGADDVVASTSVAGTSLQATQGFQLQANNVSISSFSSAIGSNTLAAYGQTALTVTLTNVSVGSPVNVALTSSCLVQGKATISPSSFTATSATTTIQYADNGCGAIQTLDKLLAAIVGTSAPAVPLDLKIASPTISSIAFISASPSIIYLKGSGLGETSIVTFELRDAKGQPLPNQSIQLQLATLTGGVTLEGGTAPVSLLTNALGQVSARINSGTVPTPVRVIATVVSNGINTVSSGLGIAVGFPSQLNFSLSQRAINIEGFNVDGTPNTYTIIASDRSGNPVPNGTSINFVTEGGQIEAIKQTEQLVAGIARTTANFVSSSPRPADGRITIVAYALGEESFIDLNGNNSYDLGEPYQDLGDIYKDRNFDGTFDPNVDEYVSLDISGSIACVIPGSPLLTLDASIPSRPSSCISGWGRAYVRRATETVLATSLARPVWVPTVFPNPSPIQGGESLTLNTSPTGGATVYTLVGRGEVWGSGCTNSVPSVPNKQGAISILASDANPVRFNPVAAGTTITASATDGVSVKVFGSPVPSTAEPTPTLVTVDFSDGPPLVNAGTVTISFTSPLGLVTTVAVPVRRGLASGSTCP